MKRLLEKVKKIIHCTVLGSFFFVSCQNLAYGGPTASLESDVRARPSATILPMERLDEKDTLLGSSKTPVKEDGTRKNFHQRHPWRTTFLIAGGVSIVGGVVVVGGLWFAGFIGAGAGAVYLASTLTSTPTPTTTPAGEYDRFKRNVTRTLPPEISTPNPTTLPEPAVCPQGTQLVGYGSACSSPGLSQVSRDTGYTQICDPATNKWLECKPGYQAPAPSVPTAPPATCPGGTTFKGFGGPCVGHDRNFKPVTQVVEVCDGKKLLLCKLPTLPPAPTPPVRPATCPEGTTRVGDAGYCTAPDNAKISSRTGNLLLCDLKLQQWLECALPQRPQPAPPIDPLGGICEDKIFVGVIGHCDQPGRVREVATGRTICAEGMEHNCQSCPNGTFGWGMQMSHKPMNCSLGTEIGRNKDGRIDFCGLGPDGKTLVAFVCNPKQHGGDYFSTTSLPHGTGDGFIRLTFDSSVPQTVQQAAWNDVRNEFSFLKGIKGESEAVLIIQVSASSCVKDIKDPSACAEMAGRCPSGPIPNGLIQCSENSQFCGEHVTNCRALVNENSHAGAGLLGHKGFPTTGTMNLATQHHPALFGGTALVTHETLHVLGFDSSDGRAPNFHKRLVPYPVKNLGNFTVRNCWELSPETVTFIIHPAVLQACDGPAPAAIFLEGVLQCQNWKTGRLVSLSHLSSEDIAKHSRDVPAQSVLDTYAGKDKCLTFSPNVTAFVGPEVLRNLKGPVFFNKALGHFTLDQRDWGKDTPVSAVPSSNGWGTPVIRRLLCWVLDDMGYDVDCTGLPLVDEESVSSFRQGSPYNGLQPEM